MIFELILLSIGVKWFWNDYLENKIRWYFLKNHKEYYLNWLKEKEESEA